MAERRITSDYVDFYKRVEFTQPLANIWVKEIYVHRDDGMWLVSYRSNSAHHICPYTGKFISCKQCILDNDGIEYCAHFQNKVSSKVLAKRANMCRDAGLEVKFFEE